MQAKKAKLLDSFAFLKWTQKEKGWERIKSLLEYAEKSTETLLMSQLNWSAAEIKAEYPIALANCFAIATAIEHDAVLITGYPEFKLVLKLVKVEWI